jgi:hypothetical protein
VEIKISRTEMLSLVLYGCRTRSLILREEHRVKGVCEQNAEDRRERKEQDGENYIIRSQIICTPHKI